MATFGLTDTGFVIPTLEEILAAIKTDLVNAFGASIDLDNGILARFVAIVAERYALLWEQLEAVYNSQNPDTATGFALKALCLLTGTLALEAIYSSTVLTLTGTPATVVPAAQQVSTKSNSGLNKFLTAAPGTIAVLPARVALTLYATGARMTNFSKCYQALSPGGTTSAGAGPSTGTTGVTSTEVDGTVTWLYLGDGTGTVDVPGQSVLKGPIVGAARDIIQIDQPVGGWTGVINVLDAQVGYDDQSDESLRLTRDEELSQVGASTSAAIRAEVLKTAGVTSATVFHNDTDTTDVDGLLPHSVEVLARGGTDAAIAAAIFAQIAAGIQTVGTTSVVVIDSEGVSHTIKFSRPAEFDIGVAVTLTKLANVSNDPTTYPLDGDAQVAAAIVAFGNAQKAGKNVISNSLLAQCFKVPGVLDVSVCNISSIAAPGTPPAPSVATAIPITLRQLAVFDTSWITVSSSNDVA